MRCPQCNGLRAKVAYTDKRPMSGVGRAESAVRRRRKCPACGHSWITFEISAERLETLKAENKEIKQSAAYCKVMAGADEKKRAKLNSFLIQNSQRRYILEGTLIKEPRTLAIEEVGREIDKFMLRGGKVPQVKYHGIQTFIIFDVNKWVRVI